MEWRGLGGQQGWGRRRCFEERGWGTGPGLEPSSCLFGPLNWPEPGYGGTRDYRGSVPISPGTLLCPLALVHTIFTLVWPLMCTAWA